MTDTAKEIVDLERKREAARREFQYYDEQIFRLKFKDKPLTQEECERISKLIGSNLREEDDGQK